MDFEHLDDHNIAEATTGSAWMFYNHYNPELLQAMQTIITGDQSVDEAVNSLLERTIGMASIPALGVSYGAGVASGAIGHKLYRGAKRRKKMKDLAKKRWEKEREKKKNPAK